MDRADARAELWRRYDAGAVSADEVEARLLLLDRATDDEDALRSALDRPVPVRRRRSTRRVVAAFAVLGAVGVAVGGLAVALDGDGAGGGRDDGIVFGGGDVVVGTVVIGDGGPVPVPAAPPADPDCGEVPREDAETEPPANPALLSDPPLAPEGYEFGDDDGITPGNDPDIAMSVSAGNPAPVEILGRELDGHLPIRMRAFRYEDAEAADESALAAASTACQYAPEPFEVPDHPEIGGAVVSGPIPTTAFASWHLGDRRFIVAVETEADDDESRAEAADLAGRIAAAELDFARTAPPPG